MRLYNKTLLITGGTSGIGKALVDQLATCNNQIIVIGRNAQALEDLTQKYSNIYSYQCSLTNKAATQNTINNIISRHRDISVVINNAGIQMTPMFLDNQFSFDSIENEITTNLTAPIWICALTLKHMLSIEQAGAYINITSGLALFPKKNSAVYCATKSGLRNFSKSFRYQLEETAISVHEAILPLVDTPMTKGRGKNKMLAVDVAREIINGVENDKQEIYIGKAKLMPLLGRLSPSLMSLIMKSS